MSMEKFTASVIRGKGRGKKTVGFPTFNLIVPEKLVMKEGVYACLVWIDGKEYRGAMHYGPTPTFDEQEKVLEIFVLNFEDGGQSIAELKFEVGPYLRPVATFLTPEALRHQIALDVQRVRKTKLLIS